MRLANLSEAGGGGARSGASVLRALIGALLLVLVACGDDDAAEADSVPDPADTGAATDDEASGVETDESDAPDDGADGGEAEDVLVPAEVTNEDGMATMRPPADVAADCEAVDELAPGARLAFPTDASGTLDAGPGPVRVEFVGCSNTFEANLVYDAFHGEDRTPTLTESTMGGAMGDWGEFRFEEVFWTPGRWTVVVYEDDAATGDRQEYDQVTFSID